VTTGFACNNRCTFCAQGQLYRVNDETRRKSAREQLRQLFEEVEQAPDPTVVVVGGEPTLDDALPDLIMESRARGATSVHVQTNGRRLAYANYVRQLKDSGLDSLEISIAGPREDIHDYHTRARGSFGQSVTGIRNAKRAGLDIGLTLVVTRSNYRHLFETVELASSLAVRALHFAFAQPLGRAYADFPRVVPRIEACIPHLTRAGDLCRQVGLALFVSGFPRCRLPRVGIFPLQGVAPIPEPSEKPCCDCKYRAACPGISAIYRGRYSAAEIVAVRSIDYEQSYPVSSSAPPFVGLGRVENSG